MLLLYSLCSPSMSRVFIHIRRCDGFIHFRKGTLTYSIQCMVYSSGLPFLSIQNSMYLYCSTKSSFLFCSITFTATISVSGVITIIFIFSTLIALPYSSYVVSIACSKDLSLYRFQQVLQYNLLIGYYKCFLFSILMPSDLSPKAFLNIKSVLILNKTKDKIHPCLIPRLTFIWVCVNIIS